MIWWWLLLAGMLVIIAAIGICFIVELVQFFFGRDPELK